MAYLNADERAQLVEDLSKMKFNQAKGKLRGMDRNARVLYLRNVQNVNQWATRYDLPGCGVQVTLIEKESDQAGQRGRFKANYELSEVVVEARAENRT